MAVRLEILVDDKGTPQIKRMTGEVKRSFDEVEKKAKTSAVRMSSDYRTAGADIGATFRRMQMGFFAFAGVAAGITAAIKATIDYGDSIRDLSKATGIATETLSALDFAAKQSGTNINAVALALKTLAMRAGDAQSGLAEATRSFSDLGINIFDASGKLKTIETLFFEVADAIKNTQDKTKALSLASELLGRGALELGALMSEGSVGVKAMMEEAKKLGQVWSKENADAADAAADAIGRFNASLVGLRNEAIIPILPALTSFFDRLAITADLGLSIAKLWYALHTRNPVAIFKAAAEVTGEFAEAQREMAELIKRESAPAIGWLSREAYDAGKALDTAGKAGKGVVDSFKEMPKAREEGPLGDIRGQIKSAQELITVIGQMDPILSDANIQFGMATDHFGELYDKSVAITGHIASNMTSAILNINAKTKVFKSIVSSIGQAILAEIVAALVQAIAKAVILRAVMAALGFVGLAQGGVVEGKQRGGVVGSGVPIRTMGGDNRLIAAQTGEGILTRRTVQRLGGETGVRALNEGGTAMAPITVNVYANTADEMFFRRQFAPLMNDLIRHTPTDLMASRLGRR